MPQARSLSTGVSFGQTAPTGKAAAVPSDTDQLGPHIVIQNPEALRAKLSRFMALPKDPKQPRGFALGLAGASGSGKSTITFQLQQALEQEARDLFGYDPQIHGPLTTVLNQDNYFKDQSERLKSMGRQAFLEQVNLDQPGAVSLSTFFDHVRQLLRGQSVYSPIFDFAESRQIPASAFRPATPLILFEGVYAFHDEPQQLPDDQVLRLAIELPEDLHTRRWWQRAREKKGYDPEVKPDEWAARTSSLWPRFIKRGFN